MTLFYKKITIAIIIPCVLNVFTGFALAGSDAGNDPFTPGFSGYLQPMVGLGYSESLSDVGDENRRIDSLDQDAESETEFVPMLLWNLGYTLKNGTTRFFAGTPEDSIVDGTFLLEAGVQQKLPGGTVLSAAYVPQVAGLDDEAWTDPYLLGSDRTETDRDAHAFRVAAESIFGSPVTLKYGFGTQDIDDDQAGLYLSQQPGSPLSASDLESLKRSGDFHRVEALYAVRLGEHTRLQPGLVYTRGDADGEANCFNRYGGQLSLTSSIDQYRLFSTISISRAEYDEDNPVFAETRDEWEYSATFGAGYMAPFGFENFMVNFYTGVTREDSNIGFYDSTAIVGGIGLTWMF